MKKILGVLLILVGIALSMYVGFYIMFLGGVIDILEASREVLINRGYVAVKVVQVLSAPLYIAVINSITISFGIALIDSKNRKKIKEDISMMKKSGFTKEEIYNFLYTKNAEKVRIKNENNNK